jgi:hypothetical protein
VIRNKLWINAVIHLAVFVGYIFTMSIFYWSKMITLPLKDEYLASLLNFYDHDETKEVKSLFTVKHDCAEAAM